MRSVALLVLFASPAFADEPTAPSAPIVPPEVLSPVEPTYPKDAFLANVTGDVVMDVDIDDEGTIQRVLVKTSPDPRLAWAALGAVANMECAPATQNGVSIPVRIEYKLSFVIDEVERERALAAEEARALASSKDTARVNLAGRVLIGGERMSVPGAFVSVDVGGVAFDAVTGDDGSFELRGVPAGKAHIHVEAGGFLPGDVDEDVKENVRTDVNLFLVKKPGAQDETTVYERRTQREVSKRVLTQKELTRVPGTFGDAIRVVQRLPGVGRAPFGLGLLLVRGGSPNDSTVLIDGHLTRILFHLGAGPSVINSDLVDKLELYPGGQGVRFGRAIAGAVDVVTRDPKTDTYAAKATVDLLQSSFRLEGPLPLPLPASWNTDGKIGFFAAGRTSYVADILNVGNLITKFDPGLGLNQLTLAPRYSDYQAKLIWKLPYRQSISLLLLGSADDLDLALDPSTLGPNAPSNVGITIGFHRLNPVYKWASADENVDGTPKLRVWISPAVETSYSENRFDSSQFRLDVQRASLRAEVELRPTANIGILAGTDDTAATFHSVTDVPAIIPDERFFPRPVTSDPPRFLIADDVLGTSYSSYLQLDAKLGDLLLVGGLRADLWTYYDKERTSVDPRFALRYEVWRWVTLKGSVGLYHQTATPFELAKKFGNPDLPLEYGWQASAGFEAQLTRSLEVDAQLFGRTAENMAELEVSPLSFFASGAPRIQPTGEQRVVGAEFLLRQHLDVLPAGYGGVFGWVAYTLMKAEARSNKPVGIEDAVAYDWAPSDFDQTHNLSVAVSWQTPVTGLEIGGAVRYVTGNPATLAQSGIFDADTSGHQRVNDPYYSDRLPPFFQLDARVDQRFTFDTWALGLFLDLQNVTNRQNFELFQYNYDYSQVEGFPGLPILPVIGAEASF